MARDRFPDPYKTKRLDLSEGDWIEVKMRLTNEEQRRMQSAAIEKSIRADKAGESEIAVDWAEFGIARVMAWVVDWSFQSQGHHMPFNRASVCAIDAQSAAEIDRALDAHIDEVEAGNARRPIENGSMPALQSAAL